MVAGERALGEVNLNMCYMRKNNAKHFFRDLRTRLDVIAVDDGLSLAGKFNESIDAINSFLKVVRDQVVAETFKDKLEEVYFFKFEKPAYVSLKIYHIAQFTLLKQKPAGTPELIRVYYLEELRFIARFFKRHAFHYEYFRSGFTELDELLFIRGVAVQSALIQDVTDIDPQFSTNCDYLFAKFMAYELLEEFILEELKQLDQQNASVIPMIGGKKWFDWTGEVINLVELGYGLYLSKQIGGGKAGLQEIFNWLEESFGVVIGIPANRFRELKRRKKLSRTYYTEFMRDCLLNYMDEDLDL